VDDRSQTIAEFCESEHISKTTFYGLLKRNLGPEVFEVPGTTIKRITPAAREAWHALMRELAESEAAKLEVERRRELAAVAGRIAARSPLHVSKAHRRELAARSPRKKSAPPTLAPR
jgi:hypothetical protein